MPPKGSNQKKRKGAAALSDAAVAVAAAHGIKLDNGRDGSPASGGGLVTTSTGSLAYVSYDTSGCSIHDSYT
jgi:hypothetical protein